MNPKKLAPAPPGRRAEHSPAENRPRQPNHSRTVRLALLFTLVMLGFAWLLIKFGGSSEPKRTSLLWIQTHATAATAGQAARLSCRVVDEKDKPVVGFRVVFWRDSERLGGAATDDSGLARIDAAFAAPGRFVVSVQPDPAEKRDFQVANRASIEVTVIEHQ